MPMDPMALFGLNQGGGIADTLRGLVDIQGRITQGKERDLEMKQRQQAIDDDEAIRQVMQTRAQSLQPWQGPTQPGQPTMEDQQNRAQMRPHSTDGDPTHVASGGIDVDGAIYDLHSMGKGSAALKLQDKVFEWRKQQAEELKSVTEANKVRVEMAAKMAQGITDDASFARIKPRIATLVGDNIAGMLGDRYNADTVNGLVKQGATYGEMTGRMAEVFGQTSKLLENQRQWAKDGNEWQDKQPKIIQEWTNIASGYLAHSTGDTDWKNGLDLLDKGMQGLPVSTRDAVLKQIPAQFSKRSVEAVRRLGMTQGQQSEEASRTANLNFEKSKASGQDDVPLSKDSIEMLAQQFARNGQLPPMGLGKFATSNRDAVINRAADVYKGLDLASQSAAFKAYQASLGQQQQTLNRISSYESTGIANLKNFLAEAKKTIDSGSPLLNKPIREIAKSVLGSKQLAGFETARQVVVPEFARILTAGPTLSGVTSDSARSELDNIMKKDYTFDQLYKSAQVLVSDVENRKAGVQKEIADLQTLMKATPATFAQPSTQQAPQQGSNRANPTPASTGKTLMHRPAPYNDDVWVPNDNVEAAKAKGAVIK